MKLVSIYLTSFYGSNLWDLFGDTAERLQNLGFYPYFRAKPPYRIKINVTPSILILQTFEIAHFEPQY